jgi:hypothetical protein
MGASEDQRLDSLGSSMFQNIIGVLMHDMARNG